MTLLHAGSLDIFYEKGFLRYIKAGSHEIVRMIYFALRDENWGTFDTVIENEEIKSNHNSFSIAYTCFQTKDDQSVFTLNVTISGESDGTISFLIEGKTLKDIYKNRAGFCVLHPTAETKGTSVTLTHVDDKVSETTFPYFIDPLNPFKQIKSMQWKIGNATYQLLFEGDIFETEDQRNWTDASFKTFCTPLDLPFPVLLKKETRIRQRVILKSNGPIVKGKIKSEIQLTSTQKEFAIPDIGLGASSTFDLHQKDVVKSLTDLGFFHYRFDLHLNQHDWIATFSNQALIASTLHVPIEAVLHVDENFKKQLEAFSILVLQNRVNVKQVLILSKGLLVTQQQVIEHIPLVKEKLPNIKFGVGTDYNFTELNRNRFDASHADFINYSVHPQEHAFDDLSLIENIQAQLDTVISAKNIYPQLPVHVSPITLRRRFNPYATDPSAFVRSENQRIDPRQITSFCAVWTLGSIKNLIEAGVSSATYYETTGLQGVISDEGIPFPVFKALQSILLSRKENHRTIAIESSNPLIADGILLSNRSCFVWNYTPTIQHIRLPVSRSTITLQGHEFLVIDNS